MAAGDFAIGQAGIGRISGKLIAVLAYPLRDDAGTIVGVLGLPLDLTRFHESFATVALAPGTIITIVDDDGVFIARSSESEKWVGQNGRGEKIVDAILRNERGVTRALDSDGIEKFFGFVRVPLADWRVYAVVPVDVALASVHAARAQTDWFAALAISIATLFALFISAQFVKPIRMLAETVNARTRGNSNARVPVRGPREIATLDRQFNAMVDARVLAEEKLRESEEKFATVFKVASGSMILTSMPDGKTLEANDKFTQITGYSQSEVFGKTTAELGMWANRDALKRYLEILDSDGNVKDFEADLNHKSGEIRNGLLSGRTFSVQGKQYLIGSFYDITERKRAEEKLRESERNYRALMDQAADGILISDGTGKYIDANASVCTLLGYSRDELVQMTSQDVVAPADMAAAPLRMDEFRAGKILQSERMLVRKDGTRVPVEIRAKMLEDGRVQGILRDITERKRAEAELHLSEERFSKAFQISPAGITITRIADGKFIDVNESFLRMFEFSRAEVIGHTSTELNMWTMDEREKLIQAQLESGGLQDFELEAQSKSGRSVNILFSSKPLELEGEACHITTMIDITERKRAEAELERRADELAALYQTSLEITAVRDLDELLRAIVERAAKLLNVPGGTLYLCDAEKQIARCVVSLNMARDYVGTVVRYGEGVSGRVAQSGQPLVIADYLKWEGKAEIYKDEPNRALISVPLRWLDQVIGVLQTVENFGGRQFTASEVDMVLLFANQAAIAITNARLLASERAARAQAQILATANAALTQSLDLDVVLNTLLEYLQLLVPYDSANVRLLEGDTRLTVHAQRGYEKWTPARPATIDLAQDFAHINAIMQARGSEIVADTWGDAGWKRIAGFEYIRSWLGIPLVSGGQVIGFYSLDHATPNFFTDEHRARAEVLSAQAAVAIHNARLFDQVQRRVDELESLHQASLHFNQVQDLPTLAERVLESLDQLLTYQRGAIALRDETTGELQLFAHARMNLDESAYQKEIARVRGFFAMPQGITRWVAEHGEPIRTGNVKNEPRYLEADPTIQSEMAVPLRVGERVIGALNVESALPNAFSEHDERLLTTIANVAAVAIQNARLLESERVARTRTQELAQRVAQIQEEERRALARELHDRVGQGLAALSVNLSILRAQLPGESDIARQRLNDSAQLVQDTVKAIRNVMTELRPLTLDDYGLDAAIREYAEQFARRHDIRVVFDPREQELPRLGGNREMTIYRVTQEALTNVARHARAHLVTLALTLDDAVTLTIHDDGVGFAPAPGEKRTGGYGLEIMRERVETIGGKLTINSTPGAGTTIEARVPISI